MTVINPQGGQTGTIGRFWTDAFGQAYDQLETLLAAEYDRVPRFARSRSRAAPPSMTSRSSATSPTPQTVSALIAAGYTIEADQNCQRRRSTRPPRGSTPTPICPSTPTRSINQAGHVSSDELFTDLMMSYCRQVLGPACVLENNSLRVPPPPEYQTMYVQMQSLGQPIAFQTATAAADRRPAGGAPVRGVARRQLRGAPRRLRSAGHPGDLRGDQRRARHRPALATPVV